MEARIIGPESELGDVRDGLTIQGQHLTRDWGKMDAEGAALTKLKGNRYVELREGKTAKPKADETDIETVKARLTELGVEFKPDASLKALTAALSKAEAAQAQAEADAEAAQAEADRLAAEAEVQPQS